MQGNPDRINWKELPLHTYVTFRMKTVQREKNSYNFFQYLIFELFPMKTYFDSNQFIKILSMTKFFIVDIHFSLCFCDLISLVQTTMPSVKKRLKLTLGSTKKINNI